MQYAIVGGERALPGPKSLGTCPACEAPVLAKCGSKVAWHWAHKGRLHCDPWWDNETDWHRSWKACFSEDWREQVRFAEGGEKHVADVLTPEGLVLEFQNLIASWGGSWSPTGRIVNLPGRVPRAGSAATLRLNEDTKILLERVS